MTTMQRAEVVGRRILICRKNSEMSQNDVCSIIGIAPQTYSGYENGKHEPALETLVRLAYLYRVTLDFLMDKNSENVEQRAFEEYEYLNENETFSNLKTDMLLIKEEISELRNRIDKEQK